AATGTGGLGTIVSTETDVGACISARVAGEQRAKAARATRGSGYISRFSVRCVRHPDARARPPGLHKRKPPTASSYFGARSKLLDIQAVRTRDDDLLPAMWPAPTLARRPVLFPLRPPARGRRAARRDRRDLSGRGRGALAATTRDAARGQDALLRRGSHTGG